MRAFWRLLIAVAAVAVCARVSFPIPGAAVPQSAQTIAVLAAGAVLGPVVGAASMVAYWLLGVAGVPLFADGRSGWVSATGGSFGYFVGFVAAAAVMGWLVKQHIRGERLSLPTLLTVTFGVGVVAHLLILISGSLWLALSLGLAQAIEVGFRPFVWGAIVKSAMVAAGIVCWLWIRSLTTSPTQTTPTKVQSSSEKASGDAPRGT